MRVASRPRTREAERMNSPDLDLDELFLDAADTVILAALERIGDDPQARFQLFRRLLAVAQEAAEDQT